MIKTAVIPGKIHSSAHQREITVTHVEGGGIVLTAEDDFSIAIVELTREQTKALRLALEVVVNA